MEDSVLPLFMYIYEGNLPPLALSLLSLFFFTNYSFPHPRSTPVWRHLPGKAQGIFHWRLVLIAGSPLFAIIRPRMPAANKKNSRSTHWLLKSSKPSILFIAMASRQPVPCPSAPLFVVSAMPANQDLQSTQNEI